MQQEIRGVKAADHDRIRQMFRSGNFTPRRSWRTQDAGEMACSGLQDGAWQGLGVADEGGVLESYLDYKLRGESELQIGFIITDTPHRRSGLATRLIDHVRRLHPNHSISTTTTGRNWAMRSVLERAGFHPVGIRFDRLNEDCTVFYRLPGPRGVSRPISGATCIYNWSRLQRRLAASVFEGGQVVEACPGQGHQEVLEGVDPNASFFLPHIDLTTTIQIPLERDELMRGLRERGIYILNEVVADISKRRVQQACARLGLKTTLAQREGHPRERLIVKTDRNFGGGPEMLLPDEHKATLGVEPPTHGLIGCQSYVVTTRYLLKEEIFDHPQLVVERYIDNKDSLIYRAYVLGDRLVLSEVTSEALIKKMTPDVSRKNHFLTLGATPEESHLDPIVSLLTRFCEGFGLDFGTIDIVKDDQDRYYIIDANTTPGWTWTQRPKGQPGVVEHLAGAKVGGPLTASD